MNKSKLENKRQRFHEKKTIKISTKALYGGTAFVVIVAGLILFGIGATQTPQGTYKFSPVNYRGLRVDPVTITSVSDEAGVSISLSDLEKNKIVNFEYATIPLVAFITSNGDAVVAIRVCEPCDGQSFSIVDGALYCNACGTRWDLQTNVGISGGCKMYPPERINYSVENGRIYVDAEQVLNWRPRV